MVKRTFRQTASHITQSTSQFMQNFVWNNPHGRDGLFDFLIPEIDGQNDDAINTSEKLVGKSYQS